MRHWDKPGVIIIEGHVQGLANLRVLGREGIPGVVVDKVHCIARYSKYCRGFFKCPDFIEDAFADFLIDLAEQENLHGWALLPSNDHAVYTLAKHKKRLECVYKLITPPLDVFETIYDKSRLLNLAQELGLPFPMTEYYRASALEVANLHFPVMTKGKKGLTFYKKVGKKAVTAENLPNLRRTLAALEQLLPLQETFTQEIIPFDGTNKTISFTAFCVDGEIKTFWMGEKLREHPLQFGTATFCKSVYQQECLDQSKPLLQALHYTGVCEVEYLRDPRDGQFKLIEINARTWLWVGLAVACGVNYPLYVYNHLNGIVNHYPTLYPVGVKWRNYWTDAVFSLQALVKGRLMFSDYLLSLKGDWIVDAVRDKDDPKPFWAMTRMLFKMAISR